MQQRRRIVLIILLCFISVWCSGCETRSIITLSLISTFLSTTTRIAGWLPGQTTFLTIVSLARALLNTKKCTDQNWLKKKINFKDPTADTEHFKSLIKSLLYGSLSLKELSLKVVNLPPGHVHTQECLTSLYLKAEVKRGVTHTNPASCKTYTGNVLFLN